MALEPVQKYFNMALSALISNRSETNIFQSLPDDFRKFKNIKVSDVQQTVFEVAIDGTVNVPQIDTGEGFTLIITSHPVEVTKIQNTTLGTPIYTSLICLGRDRSGSSNYTTGTDYVVTFKNSLDGPNYASKSGGTTAQSVVEVLKLQVAFEA